MPTTYTLIASNTLGSAAANVTFSSIPSTYTDLALRWSVRTDAGTTYLMTMRFEFNGDTGTNYSSISVYGDGVSAQSNQPNNATFMAAMASMNGTNTTTNTFASGEIYLPSYTASQNKSFSLFGASETSNTVEVRIAGLASLWRNTAAINQIKLTPSANNFASGSTFYLYGIKNS